MKRPLILSSILGLVLAAPVYATNYVFTTINPAGQSGAGSSVFGLNDHGQLVVGTSNGGLIYQNGVYTPLPIGPAGYTLSPEGINDAGTIVGTARDANGNSEGFILKSGSYSLFSIPGSAGMDARAVSPSGIVSGVFGNSVGNGEGFTYDPTTGVITDINPSGSILTTAQGMNTAGQLVGSGFSGTSKEYGFIYQNASYLTFTIPGADATEARGINDSGLIAGFAQFPGGAPGSGTIDAFVGNPSSGYQLLSDPLAAGTGIATNAGQGTFGEAINNSGQIAGDYTNANGNTFGFLATPVTLPSGTLANGAFAFDVSVNAGDLIYIDPAVAIGYQYQIGAGDPNFQSVVLPIGIGDSLYTLSTCDGTSLGTVAGGTTYDFGSGGLSCFDVNGISASAGLNPNDPEAFATGLTFASNGDFTGTMTPMVSNVPEPGTLALLVAGLLGLALTRKRSSR